MSREWIRPGASQADSRRPECLFPERLFKEGASKPHDL
jgi:hypothetical protein